MNNNIINLKGIITEDFINYKYPSMFLITSKCDWKCCNEANIPISCCQNQETINNATIPFYIDNIITIYLHNDISKAIVFGGLEPFMQFNEILNFIAALRFKGCKDDVVIYTGYNKEEIEKEIIELQMFENIIIKYGRFIPNQTSHFDPILGVNLISDNQYAERIS